MQRNQGNGFGGDCMDIDFSSIDNLPNKVIENKVQKDSVKPSKKYMTQVKNKKKEEKWINKQCEYIKESESLRGKITKGILLGEDIKVLLLSAIECIYLMTGDTAFYNQNKKNIDEKY